MLPILLILASFAPRASALPAEYTKNERIRTETTALGNELRFVFGFNDPAGNYTEWTWKTPASELEASARAFGLYGKNPNDIRATDQELHAALFKKNPMVGVMADFSALVSRYYDSVSDLHQRWRQYVDEHALSKRQSIEVLLVFLQDFPYGRPGQVFENRIIADLFVPPLIFRTGYGDCDSKSLLMATVLQHEAEFKGKLAMILVPGHALLGIETEPGPFDEYYEYQNRKYVVAEPTGLARTPFGRKNSPYSTLLVVEPIRPEAATASANSYSGSVLDFTAKPRSVEPSGPLKELTGKDCGRIGVLLESRVGSPSVRVQSCYVAKGKDVFKNGPQIEFGPDGMPAKRSEFKMGQLVR